MGPELQAGLAKFKDHPIVGEVRGVGMLGAIELTADKNGRAPLGAKAGDAGTFCRKQAMKHGLILRATDDSMLFSPPLIMNEDEMSQMFEIVSRALDETAAHFGKTI